MVQMSLTTEIKVTKIEEADRAEAIILTQVNDDDDVLVAIIVHFCE